MQQRRELGSNVASSFLWRLLAVHAFGKDFLLSSRSSRKPNGNDLYHLLAEARWSMATDSKDKGYGLYGLLKAGGVPLPFVAYEKPPAQIYRETAAAIIQSTNSLMILRQVDGLGATPRRASWAPDWSSSKHSIWADTHLHWSYGRF